mgnify:CR=1 FL=1
MLESLAFALVKTFISFMFEQHLEGPGHVDEGEVFDDAAVREALARLIGTVGLRVQSWADPQAFVAGFDREGIGAIARRCTRERGARERGQQHRVALEPDRDAVGGVGLQLVTA